MIEMMDEEPLQDPCMFHESIRATRLSIARELFVFYTTEGAVEPVTASCIALAGATAFLELAAGEGLLADYTDDDPAITGDKCLEDLETGQQKFRREMNERLERKRATAQGCTPNETASKKPNLVLVSD